MSELLCQNFGVRIVMSEFLCLNFCVEIFVSEILGQNFCVRVFVSQFLCQIFCVSFFVSEFWGQNFRVGIFVSEFLCRNFRVRIIVPEFLCQNYWVGIVGSAFLCQIFLCQSFCVRLVVTGEHWTGSPKKSLDQIGKNCRKNVRKLCFRPLRTISGHFSDIFSTFFGHLVNIPFFWAVQRFARYNVRVLVTECWVRMFGQNFVSESLCQNSGSEFCVRVFVSDFLGEIYWVGILVSECVSVYQNTCVRIYVSEFGKRIGQNLSQNWALVNIWAIGECVCVYFLAWQVWG